MSAGQLSRRARRSGLLWCGRGLSRRWFVNGSSIQPCSLLVRLNWWAVPWCNRAGAYVCARLHREGRGFETLSAHHAAAEREHSAPRHLPTGRAGCRLQAGRTASTVWLRPALSSFLLYRGSGHGGLSAGRAHIQAPSKRPAAASLRCCCTATVTGQLSLSPTGS